MITLTRQKTIRVKTRICQAPAHVSAAVTFLAGICIGAQALFLFLRRHDAVVACLLVDGSRKLTMMGTEPSYRAKPRIIAYEAMVASSNQSLKLPDGER